MSILQLGHKAPSFTLLNTDKKEIQLSDYHGKNVILLFFPFAFTGVCTKEMCIMRDDIANYQKLNAEILGISVDSPFTLAKLKKKIIYRFRYYLILIKLCLKLMIAYKKTGLLV